MLDKLREIKPRQIMDSVDAAVSAGLGMPCGSTESIVAYIRLSTAANTAKAANSLGSLLRNTKR